MTYAEKVGKLSRLYRLDREDVEGLIHEAKAISLNYFYGTHSRGQELRRHPEVRKALTSLDKAFAHVQALTDDDQEWLLRQFKPILPTVLSEGPKRIDEARKVLADLLHLDGGVKPGDPDVADALRRMMACWEQRTGKRRGAYAFYRQLLVDKVLKISHQMPDGTYFHENMQAFKERLEDEHEKALRRQRQKKNVD